MVMPATPQFDLGRTVATPGAIQAMAAAGQSAKDFLPRHVSLDQGELPDDDYQQNIDAIGKPVRVFSAYLTASGERLWVITEHDRSVTTILLPEEY